MAWKQIPWADEVAGLSDVTPEAVDGTAGAAGTGTAASREDHIHMLGPMAQNIDFDQKEILKAVIEQLAVAPATPVQGQVYYDTADDHVYVYVVT